MSKSANKPADNFVQGRKTEEDCHEVVSEEFEDGCKEWGVEREIDKNSIADERGTGDDR